MRFGSAIKLTLSAAAALVLAAGAFAASRPSGTAGTAEYLGSFTWRSPQSWFGGFSALEISGDGQSMTVLSDRATIAQVSLQRENGRVTAAGIDGANALLASSGKPLTGHAGDSEGIAVTPDGTICISYEGVPRVACHRKANSRAEVLPRHGSFRKLSANKALEALAIDGRGNLFTLPEGAVTPDGSIPVWRWNGKTWSQPFALPKRSSFKPVSADFGPDGRFYVLERDFSLFGFRSLLRRWSVTAAGLKNEETLLKTSAGTHDNLEGLSVWQDAGGRLRATMVSDDNFNSLQRTELVDYALPD
jgi:hypothetical protein